MCTTWTEVSPERLDLESDGARRYLVAIDYVQEGRPDRVRWPLAVFKRGEGPTVLVTGGTHGDEFEGQVAAVRLIQQLDLQSVSGTLLVAPMLNQPACLAGTRRSPLDGADINRVFPGEEAQGPSRGPSRTIAHFVTERLIRPADVVLDLHSGGAAMQFVLSSNLQGRPGTEEFERALPVLMAFDAPYAIIFDEVEAANGMPHGGTLEAVARRFGKLALSSELGGSGRVTPDSIRIAEGGLRNVLRHLGVLPVPTAMIPGRSRSRLVSLSRVENYVEAPARAHFVPRVWLEQEVAVGETLADLYVMDQPGFPRLEAVARTDGVVVAIASRGVVEAGEAIFYIADPVCP